MGNFSSCENQFHESNQEIRRLQYSAVVWGFQGAPRRPAVTRRLWQAEQGALRAPRSGKLVHGLGSHPLQGVLLTAILLVIAQPPILLYPSRAGWYVSSGINHFEEGVDDET